MENDNKILVDIIEVLEKIKDFRDKYFKKGNECYDALSDVYCLLVSTYIYKGW